MKAFSSLEDNFTTRPKPYGSIKPTSKEFEWLQWCKRFEKELRKKLLHNIPYDVKLFIKRDLLNEKAIPITL